MRSKFSNIEKKRDENNIKRENNFNNNIFIKRKKRYKYF